MKNNRESTINRNAEYSELYWQCHDELRQRTPPEISISAMEVVDYMIANKKVTIRNSRKRVIQCIRDHTSNKSLQRKILEVKKEVEKAKSMKDPESVHHIKNRIENVSDLHPNNSELQSLAAEIKSIYSDLYKTL